MKYLYPFLYFLLVVPYLIKGSTTIVNRPTCRSTKMVALLIKKLLIACVLEMTKVLQLRRQNKLPYIYFSVLRPLSGYFTKI